MKKKQRKPTPPAALPPIPTDTPEGIVARTVDKVLRELSRDLDVEDADDIAKSFGLPALFVRHAVFDDNYSDDERIAEYIAWRQRVGGKAAA